MPIRSCCCSDTCTNPTGTRTITSTFEAVAVQNPTAGLQTTFDYLQQIDLNCSGTSVLDTSTVRIRYKATFFASLQYDTVKEIDMTLGVKGELSCSAGSSHTCGDCGSGEFPGGVYTYGPRLVTPYIAGSTQVLSVTVNSYTSTEGGTSVPGTLGFYLRNSSVISPGPTAPFYAYDGTNIGQPNTSPGTYWEPLRVWRSSKTSGEPTDVCLPEWTVWGFGFSATPQIRPLCPADKTAMEAPYSPGANTGWVFSTYTRTATMV